MTLNKANARIYGGELSAIYMADLGSTFPDGLDVPGVDFTDLGWLGEDGTSYERETDTAELKGHQGGRIVRSKTSLKGETFKFQCLEETAVTMGLAYPGATFTTVSGVTTIVPSGAASIEKALISDEFDGSVQKRTNIIRGEVSLAGEVVHKSDEGTILEFEVVVYDHTIVSNNPALETA